MGDEQGPDVLFEELHLLGGWFRGIRLLGTQRTYHGGQQDCQRVSGESKKGSWHWLVGGLEREAFSLAELAHEVDLYRWFSLCLSLPQSVYYPQIIADVMILVPVGTWKGAVMGIDWLLGFYAVFVTLAIVLLTRTRKTFGD